MTPDVLMPHVRADMCGQLICVHIMRSGTVNIITGMKLYENLIVSSCTVKHHKWIFFSQELVETQTEQKERT